MALTEVHDRSCSSDLMPPFERMRPTLGGLPESGVSAEFTLIAQTSDLDLANIVQALCVSQRIAEEVDVMHVAL